MIKYLVALVVVTVLFSSYALYERSLKFEEEIKKSLSTSGPQNKSFTYAIEVANEELNVRSGKSDQLTSVARELDNLSQDKKDSSFSLAMGADAVGVKYRRAFKARKYSNVLPGADLYYENFVRNLKKNPNLSAKDIQLALIRVPRLGFPNERAFLLNTLSELPRVEDQARYISLAELTTNTLESAPDVEQRAPSSEANVSSDPQVLLLMTAYSVFLKHTSDESEILRGTVEGIMAQKDEYMRKRIFGQFLMKYPDKKMSLTSALAERSITVSDPGIPETK